MLPRCSQAARETTAICILRIQAAGTYFPHRSVGLVNGTTLEAERHNGRSNPRVIYQSNFGGASEDYASQTLQSWGRLSAHGRSPAFAAPRCRSRIIMDMASTKGNAVNPQANLVLDARVKATRLGGGASHVCAVRRSSPRAVASSAHAAFAR